MNAKNTEGSNGTQELSKDLWLKRGIVPEYMQLLCRRVIPIRLLESVSEILAMLLKQCVATWIP